MSLTTSKQGTCPSINSVPCCRVRSIIIQVAFGPPMPMPVTEQELHSFLKRVITDGLESYLSNMGLEMESTWSGTHLGDVGSIKINASLVCKLSKTTRRNGTPR